MYDCSIRGHFSSSPCGIDCLWATGCLRSNGSNDWSGQPSVGSFESLAWYGGAADHLVRIFLFIEIPRYSTAEVA